MANPVSANQPTDYTRIVTLAVHEMRTPASVVGGYLRMLLTDATIPLESRQRRMVEEADKACQRLVALMAELSDLAKLDAGTVKLNIDRFDAFELVREVTGQVREGEDRGLVLDVQGPSTGAPLAGDRTRLRGALEVAVRAVMREQPSSTVIVVRVDRTLDAGRQHARVVIAPAPDADRAAASTGGPFEEYRRGLGLGLPLARRVIANVGGRIWSALPAEGTELPLGSRGAIVIVLPILD
ncbi:MAG: HAMP domain-containing histidine kinase [Acidimicrobiia bacterium]|nr:HAMP domain-containing histidine kinase [Acidimicrobiia bacterium]